MQLDRGVALSQAVLRLGVLMEQFHAAHAAAERRRPLDEQVLRVLETPRAKEIMLAVVTEAIQRRIGVV